MALSLYRHRPSQSELKRFLCDGDYRLISNAARKKKLGMFEVVGLYDSATILMMDGGVLDIGYMQYNQFWSLLCAVDPDKETWCLVERVKTHNRVFFDLDLMTDAARPTLQQWQAVASAVGKAVQECFSQATGKQLRMFMSICAPYEKKGQVKAGAHLIIPGLVLSLERQRLLLLVVVQRLVEKHGPSCSSLLGEEVGKVAWEDVVDREVYMGINKGGLRTINSRKCQRCPKCNGDTKSGKDSCLECDGIGYKTAATVYLPSCCTDEHGQWVEDRRGSRNHSIFQWDGDNSEDFAIPDDLTNYVRARSTELFGSPDGHHNWEGLIASKKKKRRKTKSQQQQGQDQEDNNDRLPTAFKELKFGRNFTKSRTFLTGKPHELLETFVKKFAVKVKKGASSRLMPFKDVHVDNKVLVLRPHKHRKARISFFVTLSGTGCTWCINKGGEHNSNRVWLHLKSSGFDLRCFSGKMNKAHGKPCKDVKHHVSLTMPYMNLYDALVKEVGKEDPEDKEVVTAAADSDDSSIDANHGTGFILEEEPETPTPDPPQSQEDEAPLDIINESDFAFLMGTQPE